GRRLSQLCPPYATPSSNSSLDYHRSDAHIVENGFATSGVSKSAKVALGRVLINAGSEVRFRGQTGRYWLTSRLPVLTHCGHWKRTAAGCQFKAYSITSSAQARTNTRGPSPEADAGCRAWRCSRHNPPHGPYPHRHPTHKK